MKAHEENKLTALISRFYTEEQTEEIIKMVADVRFDETDLENLIYRMENFEED